jgi:hypothetical protein
MSAEADKSMFSSDFGSNARILMGLFRNIVSVNLRFFSQYDLGVARGVSGFPCNCLYSSASGIEPDKQKGGTPSIGTSAFFEIFRRQLRLSPMGIKEDLRRPRSVAPGVRALGPDEPPGLLPSQSGSCGNWDRDSPWWLRWSRNPSKPCIDSGCGQYAERVWRVLGERDLRGP